jgi:hypothetical protein
MLNVATPPNPEPHLLRAGQHLLRSLHLQPEPGIHPAVIAMGWGLRRGIRPQEDSTCPWDTDALWRLLGRLRSGPHVLPTLLQDVETLDAISQDLRARDPMGAVQALWDLVTALE